LVPVDKYFFETLVRIHRARKGAPYTGLKPGTDVDPAVALADKAIESGSVESLLEAPDDNRVSSVSDSQVKEDRINDQSNSLNG